MGNIGFNSLSKKMLCMVFLVILLPIQLLEGFAIKIPSGEIMGYLRK